METATGIENNRNKGPFPLAVLYVLLFLNNFIGAAINIELTILSVMFLMGIPGVIWLFVFLRRMLSIRKGMLNFNVIVVNDVFAIVYNYFILKVLSDLESSGEKLNGAVFFPAMNLVLLCMSIALQCHYLKINKRSDISNNRQLN